MVGGRAARSNRSESSLVSHSEGNSFRREIAILRSCRVRTSIPADELDTIANNSRGQVIPGHSCSSDRITKMFQFLRCVSASSQVCPELANVNSLMLAATAAAARTSARDERKISLYSETTCGEHIVRQYVLTCICSTEFAWANGSAR